MLMMWRRWKSVPRHFVFSSNRRILCYPFLDPMDYKERKMIRLILVLCLSFLSCNSNPSAPTPAPIPTPPQRQPAVLVLTGSYTVICLDPTCDFAEYDLSLTNSGGVGANLNYIRGENANYSPIWEFGSEHIIRHFGNNRIEAGETKEAVFEAHIGAYIAIGYKDDLGNADIIRVKLS